MGCSQSVVDVRPADVQMVQSEASSPRVPEPPLSSRESSPSEETSSAVPVGNLTTGEAGALDSDCHARAGIDDLQPSAQTESEDRPLPILTIGQTSSIANEPAPLIALVNGRSGGGKGAAMLAHFEDWLGKERVLDLSKASCRGFSPEEFLSRFIDLSGVRILVCGGDGTCSWILGAIETALQGCKHENVLPVAIMPLGTGNDLSRALGWGAAYCRAMSHRTWLQHIALGTPVLLDRWAVTLPKCASLPAQFHHNVDDSGTRRRGVICNYFGIGIEAAALHAFHTAREAAPHKFKSPLVNQVLSHALRHQYRAACCIYCATVCRHLSPIPACCVN